MQVTTSIHINKPKEDVWQAITDIEHSHKMISGIQAIDVLENPTSGLVGFKWRETRMLFGKEATEVMWITEAEENAFYRTRAESHGSIYLTEVSLQPTINGTQLTMNFTGLPQSILAKAMAFIMSPFFKGSLEKDLQNDLADIKRFVE